MSSTSWETRHWSLNLPCVMQSQETQSDFRIPRSVLRLIIVGLILSTFVVIVISAVSGVGLSELGKIGYLPFFLSAIASAARLLVQVVRFRVIAVALGDNPGLDLRGSAVARVASEFVALSTPALIGGEFIRAAWLSKRGVRGGRALWIGYFEGLMDVYVSSALSLFAAAYAFLRGAHLIALTILVVVLALTLGYTIFFLVPARRGIKVPSELFGLVSFFLGRRRTRSLESIIQQGAEAFSHAAESVLRREALPFVLKVLGLTLVQAGLYGIALWIVLVSAGQSVDLISSTLVAHVAITVAAIPVTIGGSGITEVTIQSYLSSVHGASSWAAVVLWRVASYHVVLAVSGIAFVLLMRGAIESILKSPRKVSAAKTIVDTGRTASGGFRSSPRKPWKP